MFDNIGTKIKNVVKVVLVIGVILEVAAAIICFAEEYVLLGFVFLLVCPILSWLGTWLTYAFGELVENVNTITKLLKHKIVEKQKSNMEMVVNSSEISDDTFVDITCPICGEMLSFTKGTICSGEPLFCPYCQIEIDLEKL